jgi:hypothetical protein
VLVVDEAYKEGLWGHRAGQRIVIVFNLHEGPAFFPDLLRQMPPHRCQGQPGVDSSMGIFSICSPVRPNSIGMSVLEVLGVEGNVARVRGLDPRPQALPSGRQPQLPRVRKGAAGIGVSASGAGGEGRREHGKRSSTKAVGYRPSAILAVRWPYGDRRVNTVISGRQLKRKRGWAPRPRLVYKNISPTR